SLPSSVPPRGAAGAGELCQLAAHPLDRVTVQGHRVGWRAVRLEQRPDVNESLQLQLEIVEPPLHRRSAHAASSSNAASPVSSTSASAGCDSSIRAASTAPTPASAART